jgi:hypothetical protein
MRLPFELDSDKYWAWVQVTADDHEDVSHYVRPMFSILEDWAGVTDEEIVAHFDRPGRWKIIEADRAEAVRWANQPLVWS